MFPYDQACYHLLDAYDCLYDPERDDATVGLLHPWIPIDQHRPRQPGETCVVPGHMATSSYALCRSLLPGRLSLEEHIPENWMVCWMDEMMQHEWQNGAQNLLSSKFQPVVLSWASFKEAATQATDENRNASGPFGPEHVLEENRPTLLLRLMQHALSDLQRDHRLALTVLQLMIYWKCCDDVSVLRRLLCMIMSQYKFCDGTCQERFEMGLNDEEEHDLDHYCADVSTDNITAPSTMYWH